MMKRVFKILLFFIVFMLPFRVDATCELIYDYISSDSQETYLNEATVGSGEVLEYTLFSTFTDAMGEISDFNKTIKVSFSNENGVNCTVSPLNTNIYTYSNNVFTVIEENIPIKSKPTDGTSFSFSSYHEEIAKIRCQMPTVDKFKKGYTFKITVTYEKVNRYADGDKISTNTTIVDNDIHLVNPTYINSLQKPSAGLTASIDDATYPEPCNGYFCNGETGNEKVTLKYSLQNKDFSLMYLTGMYYSLFDIRDIKTFDIKNTSGSISIPLNYGNNYIGIGALGNGSSEYEKAAKELNDYHFFECLDDVDIDDSVEEDRIFIINRLDVRSNDSTLKSLSISNAKINFNPNLKNYMVTVPNDISEVTISSQLNHGKASYVSGFGNRKVTLNEGSNTVLVKVKAENGAESVYTISITREQSNNNNLVSISVDDKVIKTSKDKYKYSIKVNNEITKVNITGVVEHSKAQFSVDNNRDLVEGSNIITITVTAPNGEKRIYELDVFRDSLISTNSDLKSITIEGYKLDFSSNVKKYSLKIKDEDELNIKVITDSDKAKSLITGNSKLQNDSVIKIKVTAEDEKTESIYEIRIIKEKKSSLIYIIIGGVVLFIVGLIVFISFGKKKDNSNNTHSNTTNHNTNSHNTNIHNHNVQKEEVKVEEKPLVEITPEVKTTDTEVENKEVKVEDKPLVEITPEVKTTHTDVENKEVKSSDPSLTELFNSTNNDLPAMPEVKADDELI